MSDKSLLPLRRTSHYFWTEKYRPKTLDQLLGDPALKAVAQKFIDEKDFPHLLFYGPAGTGKTSLAKILVKNVPCDHLYINASDERTIDTIRDKIVGFASTVSFQPLRVVILDEADFFPILSQGALRNVLEAYAMHCRFILTANYVERILDPIVSRCGGGIKVEPTQKETIAEYLVGLLQNEGVSFSFDDIAFVLNSYYPDVRRMINFCQQNTINGKLTIVKDSIVKNDYIERLIALLKTPKKQGVFGELRQLVADASFSNWDEVYRALYDRVDDYAKGKEAPVIIELADAVYQSSLVFEKEITFVAMLQKLLKVL